LPFLSILIAISGEALKTSKEYSTCTALSRCIDMGALDPVYARKLGVDDLLVSQRDNGEEALEIAADPLGGVRLLRLSKS